MSPYRRNHYLAFGLSEPIDHQGMTPAQIVASVNQAGGFGFPAHPFSRGSERFRRGGQGMPWDDLEADGYTGIELWSFVTDTAERVNSIGDLLRFVITPQRFLDHPPQRNLDEWDRLGRRRRCVGLGGADAHQIGIRIAGRVPVRLMAYKRSFRHLRTHLLGGPAAARTSSRRTAPRCSARCGPATPTSRWTRWRPRMASGSGPRETERRSPWATSRRPATGRCACGCPRRRACA